MVGLYLGVSCDRIGSSWMLREFVLGWSLLRGLEDRIECVGSSNSHPVLVQSEALPLHVDVKALLDDEPFCSIVCSRGEAKAMFALKHSSRFQYTHFLGGFVLKAVKVSANSPNEWLCGLANKHSMRPRSSESLSSNG
jgi:hypothetical protein